MIHEEEVIPSMAYGDGGRIELTGYRRAVAGSYAFCSKFFQHNFLLPHDREERFGNMRLL